MVGLGFSCNSWIAFNHNILSTNKSSSVHLKSVIKMVYFKQVQISICNFMPVFGICPKVSNNPEQFQTNLFYQIIKQGGLRCYVYI